MTAENTHTAAPDGAPPLLPAGAPGAPAGAPGSEAGPEAKAKKRRRGRREGDGRGRRIWHFVVDRGTELLAAVLTLVAAVLGVWGAQLSNENEELAAEVDSLEDAGSVLREDNASLTEDLADMTASRDSWKSRAEDARDADTGGSTTVTTEPGVDPEDAPGDITPGAAGIFRQTGSAPVTFAVHYGIDLDSQEPNWSVSSGGDIEFERRTNGFGLSTYGRVAMVDGEATYEDCDARTVLQGDLTKEQTVVGSQFCVVTSEQRWAYVKIIGLDPERETITLHIVVYTLETD